MDSADRRSVQYRFRLPVSGRVVGLRHPTGVEDLLLLEGGDDTAVALALACHLARSEPDSSAEIDVDVDVNLAWADFTVTDLDAFILRLRQMVIGDLVRADVACAANGCGQRIDISFRITDYLAHRQPGERPARASWTVESAAEPGWFQLKATRKTQPGTVAFCLPTVGDQLAVAGEQEAEEELARRCIRPVGLPLPLRRLVEEAMASMAPSFADDLRGSCPECGAEVTVYFDARQFCLQELRNRAAFIYQDIDLLARRYHWSEMDILTMPHVRRTNYAELARRETL